MASDGVVAVASLLFDGFSVVSYGLDGFGVSCGQRYNGVTNHICCCCWRVLPEKKEGRLPEPETGWTSVRKMVTPPNHLHNLGMIWKEGKHSSAPVVCAESPKAFGPSDLTNTYSVCTRMVFGGMDIKQRHTSLESERSRVE
ncbi:hypothetical protein TNCV_5012381 [Trichonephila clavipes]|nr:hypothetical protein TNCV_5012381 [Trichonephila clavipes]